MKSGNGLFGGAIAVFVLAAPVWASPRTVALSVPGMTCPACPITVKKALQKVPGVSNIDVRLEKKQVLVTFDDTKASTDARY